MRRSRTQTRQCILDAAYGLFWRQGFLRVSMDDIAARASLMASSISTPPTMGTPWAIAFRLTFEEGGVSDLKAELEQLAVDARRSPQRIVPAHPSDQRAQVPVDLRPTSKGAGFPTPVPAEAGSVPSHEGLSGRTIVMALRIVGNHRYSWMKNKRSPSVRRTRPRTFRRSMTS